ncbi:MAG: ABC transporter permease [Actinomycetes bacterium]
MTAHAASQPAATTPPAPAAAPPGRRVLRQARWDAVLVLRNGEQLLLTLVLPVLALVAMSRTSLVTLDIPAGRSAVDVVAPGVLAMAVMSTAFTGQAISTAFDRRYGVLRLLGTTPLGRSGLLVGRILAVLAVEVLQVVVLGVVAAALGWRPSAAGLAEALPLLALGTAAFTALGLLMAGTMRAEAVLAGANLVWVLLLLGGGVLLPLSELPRPVAAVAGWLPSGALAEGLRTALLDGVVSPSRFAVLAVWTAAAALACGRWFRWH